MDDRAAAPAKFVVGDGPSPATLGCIFEIISLLARRVHRHSAYAYVRMQLGKILMVVVITGPLHWLPVIAGLPK